MITYAGIALTPPTDPDVIAYLDRWYALNYLNEHMHPAYQAHGMSRLPVPTPPQRRPPRPGVLSWPTGASRWGEFHEFVSYDQLVSIRTAVGDANLDVHDLTMTDGAGGSITASMMFLTARPVLQLNNGAGDYYLLTLVDYRFFWNQVGGINVAPGASWTALINNIFASIGIDTLTVSTIHADYDVPVLYRWNRSFGPLGLKVDAIGNIIGLRLARDLLQAPLAYGTASFFNPADAKAIHDANWTGFSARLLTGGRFNPEDIARGLPYYARVVFPGDEVTHRDISLVSLAIAEAGAVEGIIGAYPQIFGGLEQWRGSTVLTAYATQAATDWYKWQLYSLVDATFRGIVPWVPSGLEDSIEWVHGVGDEAIFTRVIHPPLSDYSGWGDLQPDQQMPTITGPIDLTAASGVAGEILLSWTLGGGADATSCHVFYRGGPSSLTGWRPYPNASTTFAATSPVSVTGLNSGSSYTFTVRFVYPYGDGQQGNKLGPYSSVVTAVAP